MQVAIERALAGIRAGQSPFGCAIAQGGKVIAAEHNTVWATTDSTAHAEINAIRQACRQTANVHLQGTIVATTCEPCPMCMAALHWAQVRTVYYGATIADAGRAGFNELHLPAAEIVRLGGSNIQLIPGVLIDDCRELFSTWKAASPRAY